MISSIIAFIFEIDEFVNKVNQTTDRICRHIAYYNNSKYIIGNTINLEQENRFMSISDQTEVVGESSTRVIKQRSTQWYDIRSNAKVTGSTLYQGVGCDELGKQKNHFEKVICGVKDKKPSEIERGAM